MKKFKIEKVEEDPYILQFTTKMKYKLKKVRRIINKFDLGYKRIGAGNFLFLSKEDQDIINTHYKLL